MAASANRGGFAGAAPATTARTRPAEARTAGRSGISITGRSPEGFAGANGAHHTISGPPHSSTPVDEGRREPGGDGARTGPADLRGRRAGAVPAAPLHPPPRARPARCRGHPAGRLLRAGGGEPPADADRARHGLAVRRGP